MQYCSQCEGMLGSPIEMEQIGSIVYRCPKCNLTRNILTGSEYDWSELVDNSTRTVGRTAVTAGAIGLLALLFGD